jgi:anti-anti-sigma factor
MTNSTPSLQVAVVDPVALVRIGGRANLVRSGDFKTLIYELQSRGLRQFILDLTECLIMDSTFLGILAGFAKRLAESSGGEPPITLLNPNPRIADLLENLGVASLFLIRQGVAPLAAPCAPVAPSSSGASKVETTRLCLEAHETLMALNPANIPKFKDVAKFIAEDLERLGSKESPPGGEPRPEG